MMNYDPNFVCSGRMAKQTVKLTFAMWNFRVEREYTVGGNCLGLGVIETAVEGVYDKLPSNRFEQKIIHLYKDNGDDLEVVDDENRHDDFLKDMLVKAEIVKIEEEKC